MMKQTILTLAILMISLPAVWASDAGPVKVGEVFSLDWSLDNGSWEKTADGLVWHTAITHEQAHFIRLHFTKFAIESGDYVEIYDPAMEKVVRYTGKGFKELGDFWAASIFSDTVFVDYHTHAAISSKKGFKITEYSAGTADLRQMIESCATAADYENLRCKTRPTAVMNNAKSVAHIVFQEGSGTYVCTGSLISANNHFLTNEHCMAGGQSQCNTYEVYFAYETTGTSCTSNTASKGVSYDCDQFVTKNACYDYALCTLAGNPVGSYGFLEIDPNGVTSTSTNLYFIGHPAGYPKKLMGYGNGANDVNAINVNPIFPESCTGGETASEVEYEILSQGGSSGSPVFNESTNKVVALHHAGWNCTYSEQGWGINMKKIYPEISGYLGSSSGGNQLQVTVNITHTYIGDLQVVLTTPSSQTVTLHDKEGGSADNINTTYSVTGWDGSYAGYWTLKVTDTASADVGTLNSWSVAATPDGGSTHNASATDTPISIPDNNTTGITSTIQMY